MKKNLTAIGGSLGFIIDKPIADLYQIDRSTEIEVTPEADGLNIRFLKPNKASDQEVLSAAKRINKKYAKTMRNLAK